MAEIIQVVVPDRALIVRNNAGDKFGVTAALVSEGAPFDGAFASPWDDELDYPLLTLDSVGGEGYTIEQVLADLDDPAKVAHFSREEVENAEDEVAEELLVSELLGGAMGL